MTRSYIFGENIPLIVRDKSFYCRLDVQKATLKVFRLTRFLVCGLFGFLQSLEPSGPMSQSFDSFVFNVKHIPEIDHMKYNGDTA